MRKYTQMLLLLVLAGSVAFSLSDSKKAKMAEEGPWKILQKAGEVSEETNAALGLDAGWLQTPVEGSMGTHVFNTVDFLPGNVIWIGGYNSVSGDDLLWWSKDGGAKWKKVVVFPAGPGVVLAVRDTNLMLGATYTGEIVRTTNGGTTWDTVYSYADPTVAFFDGIKFMDDTTAFAVGDADANGLCVVKSTDAGATWTRATNLPAAEQTPNGWWANATQRQVIDTYGDNVWMTTYRNSGTNPGQAARVVRSTDRGATWSSVSVPLTGGTTNNYLFYSMNFADANVGYAVSRGTTSASTSRNYYHKTTDGGVTWSDTLQFLPGVPHADQRAYSVKPIRGTSNVVAVGFQSSGFRSRAWYSTDAGATWTDISPYGPAELYNVAFSSPTTGYAVGLYQALKYTAANVRMARVTFNVNTATVPDTIPVAGSTIQIRGGVGNPTGTGPTGAGYSPITWGNDAQNNMTRVGGDYWRKELYLQVGDTLRYKYVVNYSSGTGWEQGVVPAGLSEGGGNNRAYVVQAKDTTLDVEFWNNGDGGRAQYFRPYTAVDDSFMNVWFRVSMIGPINTGTFGFNNAVDTVGVRGGGPAGGDLNWSPTFYLTRETSASNGDGYTVPANTFWSGRVRIPKSGVNVGDTVQYKFLIGYDWGRDELQGQNNRRFRVPTNKRDTTLAWVFFNNERPSGRANKDTVIVTFRANLAKAISTGGFSIGDTLQVRTGYFGTSTQIGRSKRMTQSGLGTTYQAVDTIVTARGELLDYQYYVVKDGQDVRENYYNYTYDGDFTSEAERRQIVVAAAGAQTILDTATSVTQARRQPVFKNSRRLQRNVLVTWEVDLRPAIYQVQAGDSLRDIQSGFHVRPSERDSIVKWGVWINGPAAGGWSNPGGDWGLFLQQNLEKKMYDDGTNGDAVAGDTVYTRQILASPDSVTIGDKSTIGQVFKFGIRGGDNEGGQGGFGNNHVENISDAAATFTLRSQFGSINAAFYDSWDYDNGRPFVPTDVIDPTQPLVFSLSQNYPNPFNPSTKIQYSIPAQAKVEMKVYNLVGQEVATLVNDVKPAGSYTVQFDAAKLASGVYFYRLEAGEFLSIKKMVLLK